MNVQEGYRKDMLSYANQVRRAQMLGEIRLRGINDLEDGMKVIKFIYEGETYRVYVHQGEDMNEVLAKRLKELKVVQEKEAADSVE